MTAQKNFLTESFITALAIKAPVRTFTTAPVTLSGEQTINGVPLVANDRVLVKDQADPIENGIWDVQISAWRRAADFDGSRDVVGGTIVPAYRSSDGEILLYNVDGAPAVVTPTVDAINFSLYLDPTALGGGEDLQATTVLGNTTDQGIIMSALNLQLTGGIEADIRDAGILRLRDSADAESVTVQVESTTLAPAPAVIFNASGAIEAFGFDASINVDFGSIHMGNDTARLAFYRYGDAVSSYIGSESGTADLEYVAVAGQHEFLGNAVELSALTVLQFPTHRIPVLQFSIIANSVTVNVNQTAACRIDVEEASADFNVVLTAPAAGTGFYHEIIIEFSQGSGGHNAIWPGSVTWPGGTAPTLSAANNAIDTVHLYTRDGGTTWRGTFQQDYS